MAVFHETIQMFSSWEIF